VKYIIAELYICWYCKDIYNIHNARNEHYEICEEVFMDLISFFVSKSMTNYMNTDKIGKINRRKRHFKTVLKLDRDQV